MLMLYVINLAFLIILICQMGIIIAPVPQVSLSELICTQSLEQCLNGSQLSSVTFSCRYTQLSNPKRLPAEAAAPDLVLGGGRPQSVGHQMLAVNEYMLGLLSPRSGRDTAQENPCGVQRFSNAQRERWPGDAPLTVSLAPVKIFFFFAAHSPFTARTSFSSFSPSSPAFSFSSSPSLLLK